MWEPESDDGPDAEPVEDDGALEEDALDERLQTEEVPRTAPPLWLGPVEEAPEGAEWAVAEERDDALAADCSEREE